MIGEVDYRGFKFPKSSIDEIQRLGFNFTEIINLIDTQRPLIKVSNGVVSTLKANWNNKSIEYFVDRQFKVTNCPRQSGKTEGLVSEVAEDIRNTLGQFRSFVISSNVKSRDKFVERLNDKLNFKIHGNDKQNHFYNNVNTLKDYLRNKDYNGELIKIYIDDFHHISLFEQEHLLEFLEEHTKKGKFRYTIEAVGTPLENKRKNLNDYIKD